MTAELISISYGVSHAENKVLLQLHFMNTFN